MKQDKLIVALDVPDLISAKNLVTRLGTSISFYKVGMQLFYKEGAPVLQYLKEQNKQIFLDLKLHDIPNTVAEGLCSLSHFGTTFLNVHALGGYTMMATAQEKLKNYTLKNNLPTPKVLAVTILTSTSQADWEQMGQTGKIQEQVLHLAQLAKKAGLDGVVASAQEAKLIREVCGEKFLIVTPGIRPKNSLHDDQSRVTTPKQAFENGASHIVVGRPILQATHPSEAARKILEEISEDE